MGCTVGSNFSPALFCDFVRTSCIKLNSLSMGETPVSSCLLSTNGQNPFIGQTVRLYTTAYYAREWGNLLGQGIDLLDLVALMKEQKSKLFRELGADLEEALMLGQSFPDRIASHPFFTKELSLIIAYGEANARLGYELEVYAEEVWQAFFNRLNKATTFVQPLILLLLLS